VREADLDRADILRRRRQSQAIVNDDPNMYEGPPQPAGFVPSGSNPQSTIGGLTSKRKSAPLVVAGLRWHDAPTAPATVTPPSNSTVTPVGSPVGPIAGTTLLDPADTVVPWYTCTTAIAEPIVPAASRNRNTTQFSFVPIGNTVVASTSASRSALV
jgi:hypothetical protein